MLILDSGFLFGVTLCIHAACIKCVDVTAACCWL